MDQRRSKEKGVENILSLGGREILVYIVIIFGFLEGLVFFVFRVLTFNIFLYYFSMFLFLEKVLYVFFYWNIGFFFKLEIFLNE